MGCTNCDSGIMITVLFHAYIGRVSNFFFFFCKMRPEKEWVPTVWSSSGFLLLALVHWYEWSAHDTMFIIIPLHVTNKGNGHFEQMCLIMQVNRWERQREELWPSSTKLHSFLLELNALSTFDLRLAPLVTSRLTDDYLPCIKGWLFREGDSLEGTEGREEKSERVSAVRRPEKMNVYYIRVNQHNRAIIVYKLLSYNIKKRKREIILPTFPFPPPPKKL